MRRVGAGFHLLILLVDEDDARAIIVQLLCAVLRISDDDHQVTRVYQARGRPVDSDDARPAFAGDRISGQAIAVVDVNDVDLLALENVRGLHQRGVDGARADIMQVRLRDGGSVNLGFQHGTQHGTYLSRRGGVMINGRLKE